MTKRIFCKRHQQDAKICLADLSYNHCEIIEREDKPTPAWLREVKQ